MSDWREIMGATPPTAFVKPAHNPQNPSAKTSSADIAYENQVGNSEVLAPASPVAVELVYVEPQPKVTPVSPEFPPCRKCGARRYWITDSGKVVCGGRGCGEVCYILAAISYHPIN
jgi:hypothetical protein